MNKKSLFLSVVVSVVALVSIFATPALAVTDPGSGSGGGTSTPSGEVSGESGDTTGSGGSSSSFGFGCRDFLGLKSWDCNVGDINNQSDLQSGVWTIAANILVDITVIAAYLVIGYVIYGGYLYTMSSGDPTKVANGRKTLAHAFIGLAIVMLANVILNTIRIALGANFAENCIANAGTNGCYNVDTAGNMITSAISWAVGVAGFVSAIFVVYGGISYVTSSGDPGKVQKAKQMILYALIGLAIVALAEIITAFVSSTIRNANTTSFINETIVSKEVS